MTGTLTIRAAKAGDLDWLAEHDRHIAPEELSAAIAHGRILLAELDGETIGWLRWNLFWDNTPFMNLLYLQLGERRRGYGRQLVAHWEQQMRQAGYDKVLTSTQSDEEGQFFYRALGYTDAGCLLLPGEATELLFCKELCPL